MDRRLPKNTGGSWNPDLTTVYLEYHTFSPDDLAQIGPFDKAWVSVSTDGGLTWTSARTTIPLGSRRTARRPVVSGGPAADEPAARDRAGRRRALDGAGPRRRDLRLELLPLDRRRLGRGRRRDLLPDELAPAERPDRPVVHRLLADHRRDCHARRGRAAYATTPQVISKLLDPSSVHVGGICTFGIFCTAVPNANRDLADSIVIALDPAGGANAAWTNGASGSRRIEFACQSAGPSAFAALKALRGCYVAGRR